MATKGLFWQTTAPPKHPKRLMFLRAASYGHTVIQWFDEPVQGRRYRLHIRNRVKTWYVLRKMSRITHPPEKSDDAQRVFECL